MEVSVISNFSLLLNSAVEKQQPCLYLYLYTDKVGHTMLVLKAHLHECLWGQTPKGRILEVKDDIKS